MPALFQSYYHITADDTLRETISHGSGKYPFAYYPEDLWQFDFHRVDWHWHHEVEFLTSTTEELLCLIGENRIVLPKGYGLFINSGVLHRYEASKSNTLVPNIVFSPILLAPEESLVYEKYVVPVLHSASCQILSPQIEWQNTILKTLSSIYSLQEHGTENELQTMQLLLKIWYILFNYMKPPYSSPGSHHISHRQAQLQVMMQYIHDHYSEQITLEEIAAAVSISKSTALNIFQTGIHTPPISYLIQYRLKCAGRLLYTTEKTVSEIAEETGFSSSGYFCRKFKEQYRMTPNTYRKKHRSCHNSKD